MAAEGPGECVLPSLLAGRSLAAAGWADQGLDACRPSTSHLFFDLGNLACFDPSPVDEGEARTNPDGCCHQLATGLAQALVERLFALPNKPSEAGRVVQLPLPAMPLPRAKPLPRSRAPTKWELFAQRKGIQKQKRSKLVFDEASGQWRRRYGYKRADDPDAVPILEAKPGEQARELGRVGASSLRSAAGRLSLRCRRRPGRTRSAARGRRSSSASRLRASARSPT